MTWITKQPSSPNALPEESSGGRGNLRVLFVDDDPLIRAMAGAILQALGTEVIHASSGEEAATLLRSCGDRGVRVDLVILDLVMPGGMSGVDALDELRRIDPKVRGVASSGFFESGAEDMCSRLGFTAALTKPYSPEELSEVLGNIRNAPALSA